MAFRYFWIAAIALVLISTACQKSGNTESGEKKAVVKPLQGLESVHRVRLDVVLPVLLFPTLSDNETEAQRKALLDHAEALLHEQLPQLHTDGEPDDWTLEFRLERQYENLPPMSAKVRNHWTVCRVRLTKPCEVDGRKAIAVAYAGPVLRPENRSLWLHQERWPRDIDGSIDQAMPSFIENWKAANPDAP
ncbi:MAG: hypothetical protein JW818_05900 [Pirellulales bacterium]|nr:hypothetical protein [Pirellulales bacterium]